MADPSPAPTASGVADPSPAPTAGSMDPANPPGDTVCDVAVAAAVSDVAVVAGVV